MENNNGSKIFGKRKFAAVLVFTAGYFVIWSLLLRDGTLSGQEYIEGLSTTSYVVMAYLGVNVLGSIAKGLKK